MFADFPLNCSQLYQPLFSDKTSIRTTKIEADPQLVQSKWTSLAGRLALDRFCASFEQQTLWLWLVQKTYFVEEYTLLILRETATIIWHSSSKCTNPIHFHQQLCGFCYILEAQAQAVMYRPEPWPAAELLISGDPSP